MKRYFCLALVVAQATLLAHEIGATRIAATFDRAASSYAVEIVTGADSLVEKLEAASDRPMAVPVTDPKRLAALLQQDQEMFLSRIHLTFDGAPSKPRVVDVAVADDAGVTIRLLGQIPSGARTVTWNYGWSYTTYAFLAGTKSMWIEGGTASLPLDLAAVGSGVEPGPFVRYLGLGFTHIVPLGLDHVLFVLGLYLLSQRPRDLLLQVSAFTVAHSITLGLGIAGWVRVPSSIVEPAIALSIGYVAVENLLLKELKPWRVALVFGFGLLHGLGFAGVLAETGLPQGQFLPALFGFNLGVEAGQLAVIGVAYLLAGRHFANRSWYRAWFVNPASALIACVAVYWTFERLTS
jgi:hypothetical protein